MKNLLFVCGENQLRSPTAEAVFSEHPRVNAIGAGTNSDADTTATGDLIEWGNTILVMGKSHGNKISKKFKDVINGKELAVLDGPDNYKYMEEELTKMLKNKVPRYVQI